MSCAAPPRENRPRANIDCGRIAPATRAVTPRSERMCSSSSHPLHKTLGTLGRRGDRPKSPGISRFRAWSFRGLVRDVCDVLRGRRRRGALVDELAAAPRRDGLRRAHRPRESSYRRRGARAPAGSSTSWTRPGLVQPAAEGHLVVVDGLAEARSRGTTTGRLPFRSAAMIEPTPACSDHDPGAPDVGGELVEREVVDARRAARGAPARAVLDDELLRAAERRRAPAAGGRTRFVRPDGDEDHRAARRRCRRSGRAGRRPRARATARRCGSRPGRSAGS